MVQGVQTLVKVSLRNSQREESNLIQKFVSLPYCENLRVYDLRIKSSVNKS